jgi:hypothetical protein
MLLILACVAGVIISATSCTAPIPIIIVVHNKVDLHVFSATPKWPSLESTITARTGSSILPGRWAISYLGSLRLDWRRVILAGLVASSVFAESWVYADEFDVLTVYSDARPLNDEWQVCAASFARRRLRSAETPELLANEAFDRCQATEDRLNRFLVAKIGRDNADGVMALLRDKYRSGLAAAIRELRAPG